jgi:signal transduction histidine kinase
LYGSFIAPTALPTALGMLAVSLGLILAAGPNHWPMRPLMGTSAAAVLLRNFLPVTAAATLIGGALHIQLLSHVGINPVLVSALWALAFTAIVTFLVSGIASEIGSGLDAAEQRIEKLNEDLAHRLSELGDTNHRLLQQSEENEMFVYSVSHDLRSPLVNLQGFSKELSLVSEDIRAILTEASLPPEVQKRGIDLVDNEMGQSIRFIQTAVMRLANIIDSLLRLSRAGRVELHCTHVELDATVGRVVEALHGTINERRAKVTVSPLPPIWGDPTVLEQIFGNLIGNALNYLDSGRQGLVEVGVSPAAEANGATGTGLITCYVKDNGLGIPQAYHQKVFQAFQRFHADKAKGEGMGLASVRRLVDRHGGRIWFQSASGEGTTFFVSLPVQPPANGTTSPNARESERGSKKGSLSRIPKVPTPYLNHAHGGSNSEGE